MKANNICVFCGKKSSKAYIGKPVCDECLDGLTEWSKHLKVIEALKGIDKLHIEFSDKAYNLLKLEVRKR